MLAYTLVLTWASGWPPNPESVAAPLAIIMMILAGVFFLGIPQLIAMAEGKRRPFILLLVVVAGLMARFITFGGGTFFENDFFRYLWDGAVLANFMSPFGYAPLEVMEPDIVVSDKIGQLILLSASAEDVMEHINYPFLSTVYPMVAQFFFAAAHMIKQFDLNAWRLVLLVADVVNLLLIIELLRLVGRSRLWSALYWVNPLVIGEFFNSAHVDLLIFPFLLFGLICIIRGWGFIAITCLALATAVKVWPILLLPLFLRKYFFNRWKSGIALGLLYVGICLVLFLPILTEGFRAGSGMAAYAQTWTMNETFYKLVYVTIHPLVTFFSSAEVALNENITHNYARVLIALMVGCVACFVALTKWKTPDQLINRVIIIIAVMFLLSPTQFPWYYLWVVPFLAIRPTRGLSSALLVITATMPLYYTRYIFDAKGIVELYDTYFVWLIMIPMLIILVRDSLGVAKDSNPMKSTLLD